MEVAEGYAFLLNLVTAGVASGIYTGIMGKQLATGDKASVVSRGFALFGLVLTVVGGGLVVRAALANAGGKVVATTAVEAAEAEVSAGTTRVGRWMSQAEYDAMVKSGRVVEGAGGRVYVVEPPNPSAYQSAKPGSVYVEFDVPTNSLKSASNPQWSVIPGPNAGTKIYGSLPTEFPPATNICLVCRK